jgi:hypothetical protein
MTRICETCAFFSTDLCRHIKIFSDGRKMMFPIPVGIERDEKLKTHKYTGRDLNHICGKSGKNWEAA